MNKSVETYDHAIKLSGAVYWVTEDEYGEITERIDGLHKGKLWIKNVVLAGFASAVIAGYVQLFGQESIPGPLRGVVYFINGALVTYMFAAFYLHNKKVKDSNEWLKEIMARASVTEAEDVDWDKVEVGFRMTVARHLAGKTPDELADSLGVSVGKVLFWEDGGGVSEGYLPKVASALGVSESCLAPSASMSGVKPSQGRIVSEKEVQYWWSAIAKEDMTPESRVLLAVMPMLRNEDGLISLNREDLVKNVDANPAFLDEYLPEALQSGWLKKVGKDMWTLDIPR